MQKKIIALAIAAAISAPAFADTSNVTVYGVADVSYDSINTGTSGNAGKTGVLGAATAANIQGARSNRVSSNSSRLGVKGSEDLGDGLTAVWQIESLINIAMQPAPAVQLLPAVLSATVIHSLVCLALLPEL